MGIQGLGYVVVGTPDPCGWIEYATDIIGMMSVDADHVPDGGGYLRMDEHPFRIKVERADVGSFTSVGWEVTNGESLARLAANIDALGIAVTTATREECLERRVETMVHFEGPAGVRTELFVGRSLAETPFVSAQGASFVTGDQGLGHVVFKSPVAQECVDFYRDVLGFRLSDIARFSLGTFYFLGCNPRHHSVAFIQSRKREGAHHILCEVSDIDQVGRTLDRVRENKIPLLATLGKHANDGMFSFYMRSPADFGVEVGADGRRVDDGTWVSRVYTADVWGHHAVADGVLGY